MQVHRAQVQRFALSHGISGLLQGIGCPFRKLHVPGQGQCALSRVPGMGRKTAQRVLLELKERVETSEMLAGNGSLDAPDLRTEAVAALVSLGYDGLAAGKAVAAVEQAESVESLITAALRKLAK